jgi:hypothetical protein
MIKTQSPFFDPFLMDGESASLAIFGIVRTRQDGNRHPPPLLYPDERHVEGQGDGVKSRNEIDGMITPPEYLATKIFHNLLEHLGLGEESVNIEKSGYALEGAVGEVLDDFAGLVAVLLIRFFASGMMSLLPFLLRFSVIASTSMHHPLCDERLVMVWQLLPLWSKPSATPSLRITAMCKVVRWLRRLDDAFVVVVLFVILVVVRGDGGGLLLLSLPPSAIAYEAKI